VDVGRVVDADDDHAVTVVVDLVDDAVRRVRGQVDARTNLGTPWLLDDTTDAGSPGVAASLAVLAGNAASDARCCAKLGRRARGQDHAGAAALLARADGSVGAELGRCSARWPMRTALQ